MESALESFFIESPFNAFKEDSKYLKKTLTSLEAQSTDLSKVSNSLTSYLDLISRALTFIPIINYEFYGLSLQGERLQGGRLSGRLQEARPERLIGVAWSVPHRGRQ